jgi:predicted MFS family arabinose efflux permease
VALLWRLLEPARRPLAPRHPWHDMQEGARCMWDNPMLKVIFKTAVCWNIAWFVLQAAYVPYAFKVLGLTAASVGLTLGAFGVGMVSGAVLAPRTTRILPLGRAIQMGPTLSLFSSLSMAATLIWPSAALAVLSYLLIGLGSTTWVITSTTLRQTVTPPAMLGRVGAIFLTCNMGVRPVGAALGGLVGAHLGESACIGLALALFAMQLSLILRPAISQLKVLPEQAK